MYFNPLQSTMRIVLATMCLLSLMIFSTTLKAGSTSANLSDNTASLRARLAAMEKSLQQLKAQIDTQEQLAQQRQQLINDMIASAKKWEKSNQFLNLNAGYDDGFYLKSKDNHFRLNIEGQLDLRYIYNNSDQGNTGNDENVGGFQMRRAKIGLSGHFFTPAFTYKLKAGFDRDGGEFELEEVWVAYDLTDTFQIKGGQFTEPFLREYMVSSSAQQAVERSLVTNYIAGEYVQGIYGFYHAGQLRAWAGLTGGPDSANTDFNSQAWAYGIVSRAEYLLVGKEFDDFVAFSDNPAALLLGAGLSYGQGAHQAGLHTANALKYTADLSVKLGGGINAFVALEGQQIYSNDDPMVNSASQIGGLAQIGAFIIPDKLDVFVRYEYMDLDGVSLDNSTGTTTLLTGNDTINMITVGTNYYFKKQAAKLSFDVVYGLDALPFGSSGLGLVKDEDGGQIAVRTQFQLLF